MFKNSSADYDVSAEEGRTNVLGRGITNSTNALKSCCLRTALAQTSLIRFLASTICKLATGEILIF